jgi:hypothetical protein
MIAVRGDAMDNAGSGDVDSAKRVDVVPDAIFISDDVEAR